MLPADIPQTDHLLELVEMRGVPSITITLASSPIPADHERIRIQLRDLIDDADRQAKDARIDRPSREAAVARLRSVLDDEDFWMHQSRSLVLLASPQRLDAFRLANRLSARATVSDRFDTGSLLRAVTFPRRAFIVQISRGGARLTEFGADHGLTEHDLSLPSDHRLILEEADNGGQADFPRPQGSTGDRLERERYCRVVQDEVARIVPRGVPVILSATTDLAPAYRTVNTHPTLLEAGIDAHPESLDDAALEQRARRILDDHEDSLLAAWRERFGTLQAQGLAADTLDDVAVAAANAAVEELLFDMDSDAEGTIDDRGRIARADAAGPESTVLVDELAARVLRTGGTVRAARHDDMVQGSPVAATLRFPLEQMAT